MMARIDFRIFYSLLVRLLIPIGYTVYLWVTDFLTLDAVLGNSPRLI
jgi:hypothetical protein